MYTGMADTALSVEQLTGQVAAGVVPGVLASGAAASAAAGGSGLIIGLAPALAIPIIGAAIAGVTALIGIFMAKNAQYHAQETATTQIVDQAEKLLQQNLAAWNASNKTQSEQRQAMQNFADVWAQVVKACDQQAYGDPGQRCIHDRERGGQWPWPVYYLDPIANDPNVQPDPSPVNAVLSSLGIQQGGSMIPLLLAGLAIFAVAEL